MNPSLEEAEGHQPADGDSPTLQLTPLKRQGRQTSSTDNAVGCRVCGKDAGSRGCKRWGRGRFRRGRMSAVTRRKAEGKPRDRVDVPSSRVCGRPETSGRLVPLARYLGIHRFLCDQDRAAPAGSYRRRAPKEFVVRLGEAQDGRTRQNASITGEEKAAKRKRGRVGPAGGKPPCEPPRSAGTPGAQWG